MRKRSFPGKNGPTNHVTFGSDVGISHAKVPRTSNEAVEIVSAKQLKCIASIC